MKGQVVWILALAALLAGCSSENNEGVSCGRTALQVSSAIDVRTRAYDDTWEAVDAIDIYMFAAGTDDIAEAVENVPYTTTGDGNFTPPVAGGSTIYFPLSGAGVDFHAWHPYHAVSEKWVIDLAGQSSQSALDLLTADAVSTTAGTIYSKDHPAVRFEFVHRLFKLALSIKPGTGLSTTALAGLQVDITRQWTSADYDPRLDALSVEHASSAISLLTAADGRQAEAILFPDDWAGGDPETGRQLVFTLATGEKLYYDIPDAKRFLAGERNLYTITVNRTDLSVTSQITGWAAGNGEEGETGSAE